MKKSLKKIIASIVAIMVFMPVVKAEVIELTQADFTLEGNSEKNISFIDGQFVLPGGEYKFTENVTLPEGAYSIYFDEDDVTIDATDTTFKGIMIFVDSNVTIFGGTFESTSFSGAMNFDNSNVVIKDGTFKAKASSIYYYNFQPSNDAQPIPLNTKSITIENGTFISESDNGIEFWGGKTITINDGKFTGLVSGISLDSFEKVSLNGGIYKSTSTEDADDTGAIIIYQISDPAKMDELLSDNSVWSEEANVKVVDKIETYNNQEYLTKKIYTQKEISVSTKKITIIEAASKETTTTEPATITPTTYEVLNGANQQYDVTSTDKLTFRFGIDYSLFLASGKVYMDGNLVDTSNYETKEGSTIVIFTKAYTDLLKAGNHTMKITTANGEVTTDFTISETVKNPTTSDNIIIYVLILIISVLTLVGANFRKKKIN